VLQVTSQRHRSQVANKDAAVERFAELVGEALQEEVPRRKTRPSRGGEGPGVSTRKRRRFRPEAGPGGADLPRLTSGIDRLI